jgi:hypothetical protein
MSVRAVRVAIVLGSLAWWSCNGKLQFDVPDGGTSGGMAGSGGATAGSGAVDVCAACVAHDMRCVSSAPGCVECLDDDDCEENTDGRTSCDTSLYRCVQCAPGSDNGCSRGRVCYGWSHSCVQSCATEVDPDHDCGFSGGLTCDTTSYVCLACMSDDDCKDSNYGPHCVAGQTRCGKCATDADCSGGAPHCDPLKFECVACRDSRDCSTGVCEYDTQTCVVR